MSIHIGARRGQIAKTVLITGDPLRAQRIAETFLKKVTCYSRVRGAFGFTGWYEGGRYSVQTHGMGQASLGIYVNELIQYGAERIIRVGTCGTFHSSIKPKDIIIVQGASTDSGIQSERFPGKHFAALADSGLLLKAVNAAQRLRFNGHL